MSVLLNFLMAHKTEIYGLVLTAWSLLQDSRLRELEAAASKLFREVVKSAATPTKP